MSSREEIFKRVAAATKGLEDRTELPAIEELLEKRSKLVPEANDESTLVEAFRIRWQEANGVLLDGVAELEVFLKEKGVGRGYADPELLVELGVTGESLGAEDRFLRSEVDSYGFGITRASLGIAETGTIVLKDCETSNRLAALAPWIHVAVLRKRSLVASLYDALGRLGNDPSNIFVTGPSKTADIEGILIEGVHGPGIQVCLLV